MKKKGLLLLLGVLLYLFIMLTMIIWFKLFYQDSMKNNKKIVINDFHNAVYEQDMIPISDEEGKNISAYEFMVENISSKTQRYSLYLNEVSISLDKDYDKSNIISKQILKYQLIKNNQELSVGFLSDLNNDLLDKDILKGLTKNKYTVRIWIDIEAKPDDWNNKSFNYQFSVIEK